MTKSFLSYVELKKDSEQDVEKGEEKLSCFLGDIETIKTLTEEISHLLLELQNLNEETKSTHSAKILRGLRDRMESNVVMIALHPTIS